MMKKWNAFRTSLLMFTLLSTAAVKALDAPAGLVPAGLSPGDEFYIMFVTSSTTNAISFDIADYNTFVNAAADASSTLGTDDPGLTWVALGATSGNDQCSPFEGGVSTVPIYNTNGDKVGNDSADIYDGTTMAALLTYNASGGVSLGPVWTGCLSTGIIASAPFNRLGGSFPIFGSNTSGSSSEWITANSITNSNSYSLYAVSPLLTVPSATNATAGFGQW